MNRRRFFTFLLGSSAALFFSPRTFAKVGNTHRFPLIVHTVIWRPQRETAPCVGTLLDLRLIAIDMGHHLIGLYLNGKEIRQFRSWIAGGLIERGEPLAALVSASTSERWHRVDVILDRAVDPGERIPLLDPVSAKRGLSVQVPMSHTSDQSIDAGWHPLRCLPWCHYSPDYWSKQFPVEISGMKGQMRNGVTGRGLAPITEHRHIYNPTPWRDLDPAVPVLTQHGHEVGCMPYGLKHGVEQLLLRHERIEAEILKVGVSMPAELMLNLELVV